MVFFSFFSFFFPPNFKPSNSLYTPTKILPNPSNFSPNYSINLKTHTKSFTYTQKTSNTTEQNLASQKHPSHTLKLEFPWHPRGKGLRRVHINAKDIPSGRQPEETPPILTNISSFGIIPDEVVQSPSTKKTC